MLSLPIIEIWTQLKRQLFYADRNKSLIKFFQFRISKISKIQKINFFNYTIINNFIHFYFTFKYVFSRFQIKLIISAKQEIKSYFVDHGTRYWCWKTGKECSLSVWSLAQPSRKNAAHVNLDQIEWN